MKKEQSKRTNYLGIAVTIIVSLFFIWAIYVWFMRNEWPEPITIKKMSENEITAFQNMQKLILAQKKYKETDWDKNGNLEYARFLVQLWQTISINGEYIKVGLVNEKLGSAMGKTLSYNGYYYHDIRGRSVPDNDTIVKFNYTKEWAIAGTPTNEPISGRFVFFAGQSGEIYAKPSDIYPECYPYDPTQQGWVLIKSVEELKEYQKNLNN
jgi:hypothetical protein